MATTLPGVAEPAKVGVLLLVTGVPPTLPIDPTAARLPVGVT